MPGANRCYRLQNCDRADQAGLSIVDHSRATVECLEVAVTSVHTSPLVGLTSSPTRTWLLFSESKRTRRISTRSRRHELGCPSPAARPTNDSAITLLGLRPRPQQPHVLAYRFRAHAHLGESAIEIRERLHRSHLLRERGGLYRLFGGQIRPAAHRQAARRRVPGMRFRHRRSRRLEAARSTRQRSHSPPPPGQRANSAPLPRPTGKLPR